LPLASGGSPVPGAIDAGSAGLVATDAPSEPGGNAAVSLVIGGSLALAGGLYARARRRRKVL
jgi:hypothetical protein